MSLLREVSSDFVNGNQEITTELLVACKATLCELVVDQLDVNNLVVDTLLAHNLITLQNPADPSHVITLDPTLPSITLTDGLNTNIITAIGGGGGGGDADRLLLSDATASASTFYPTFALTTTNYQPQSASTGLSYVPSTNTLTCTNFAGNASSATSAASATTVANTGGVLTNATFFPAFLDANTSTNQGTHTSAAITFNPGTATLTCTNFAGNATTATSSTSASTVTNTGGVVTNAIFFPSFFAANTSTNQGPQTSAALTLNPGTATLTCTNFAGNASTSNAVSNTGTVTTNATFYPTFMAANTTSKQSTNTAAGLTFNPSTSLVTVSGTTAGGSANPQLRITNSSATAGVDTGTIVEVYRSNVAAAGDETGRLQFAMRDFGGSKRISGAIRSVPTATNPVYNDLVLSTAIANTLTDMVTLSGSTDKVTFNKNANFQGTAYIENVDIITTSASNCQYAPQLLYGFKTFTDNVPSPGPIASHTLRLYSQGVDPAARLSTFLGSPGVRTYDSVEYFAAATGVTSVYFATDNGVYYFDGGSVNLLVKLDAPAYCMCLYDNQILVGGAFTKDVNTAITYSFLLLIDTNHTINKFTYANYPGDEGFTGLAVNALTADGTSGWLYIGGKFNKTNGGSLPLENFAIVNSPGSGVYNVFAIDDNSGGSPNGISGQVLDIAICPTTPGRTQIIIVGDFGGAQCSPGGVVTNTFDNFATVWYNQGDQNSDTGAGNPSGAPFQYIGAGSTTFDAVMYTVEIKSTDVVYFGGASTNIGGGAYNYLAYCISEVWTIVNDGNPGALYSQPVTALNYTSLAYGNYWWVGDSGGQIYLNDTTLVTTVASGPVYRIPWSPAFGVFLLESGDTTVYAYNPSPVISLAFGGQTLYVYPDLTYTGGIILLNKSAYVDMQYLSGSEYLLVGSQGATFFN